MAVYQILYAGSAPCCPIPDVLISFAMERQHPKLDRITFDPAKCAGKACIRGTRLTVEALLSYLASGMTTEELLAEFPDLKKDDVRQALAFAAWAVSERVLEVA